MIRTLATALLALCLTSSGVFALSLDQLVMRGGVAYKKFTDEPFTGTVDEELGRGTFKNGKFEGPWIMYWGNGQLRSKGAYKNGKREGPWVTDYVNGQLSWKGVFKSGKREGPWVAYWANGQLRFKGAYKNGEREGPWVGYNSDGTKDQARSGTYRNDLKVSD